MQAVSVGGNPMLSWYPEERQEQKMASTTSESGDSTPEIPSESPGSSVSTSLREEYEELLKYAVVTPIIDKSMGGRAALRRPDDSIPRETITMTKPSRPRDATLTTRDLDGTEVVKVLSSSGTTTTTDGGSVDRQQNVEEVVSVEGGGEEDGGLRESVPRRPPPVSSSMMDTPRTIGEERRDPELVHLEMQLDMWCTDMKRNIIAEFAQCLLRLKERMRHDMEEEKARHQYDVHQLQCEVERLKDLAATYEQGIEKKDQVISKLSDAYQKQKSKVGLQHSFSQWKLQHNDEKRESFVSKIALKHYKHRLLSKVWLAWHGIIETKWRQRVEKACQARAEEVCVQLTNEYEEKLNVMQRCLDEARAEVQLMKHERDMFAENMKKAFMRGVCALNMEAMTMFNGGGDHHPVDAGSKTNSSQENSEDSLSEQTSIEDRNVPTVPAHPVNVRFSSDNTTVKHQLVNGSGNSTKVNPQKGYVRAAEPKQYQRPPGPTSGIRGSTKSKKTTSAKPMPAVVVEKHGQHH